MTPSFIKLTCSLPGNGVEEKSVSIVDFTDAQLQEIGEAWTQALIESAQDKRMAGRNRPA